MWTRAELKHRAKNVLRGNYWKAFLVSLVIVFASEGYGGSSGRSGSEEISSFVKDVSGDFRIVTILMILLGIVVTVFVLSLVVQFLVLNPLEVGGRRYFIQSAQYFDNRRCFRFAFEGRHYLSIVGGMGLRGIYLFLWFLLFIIPGIVKSYAYRMVPYILADNPNIGARRAIELSNRMTYGHKFDMFILDLSFLGWYLLGALCLGIGVFFVKPYEYATEAELYLTLRENAIERGYCSLEELNLYNPFQGEYNI